MRQYDLRLFSTEENSEINLKVAMIESLNGVYVKYDDLTAVELVKLLNERMEKADWEEADKALEEIKFCVYCGGSTPCNCRRDD